MKSNLIWAAAFILICAISLAVWFACGSRQLDSRYATVKIDNKTVRVIDLSTVTSPYEFTVKSEDGGYNTIRVESGKIAVIDADCRDKICVDTGYITNSVKPIVCLPHKMSITITDNSEDLDGYTG